VPVIASPTVPPTCWKNDTLLLAAPIWVTGTLLCTISGKTANMGPTPMPVTNIHAHRIGCGVSTRSCVSRPRPIAVMTIEPNISRRYRPVRAISWPPATALMITPPSNGSIS